MQVYCSPLDWEQRQPSPTCLTRAIMLWPWMTCMEVRILQACQLHVQNISYISKFQFHVQILSDDKEHKKISVVLLYLCDAKHLSTDVF